MVDEAARPPWLVRIVGRRIGAGVLVSARHVVTCAHVVASETLEVSFPFLDTQWRAGARILLVDPVPGDDVAVIELVAEPGAAALPPGARPARLAHSEDAAGHRYRAYGFPGRDGPPGGWSYGTVAGRVGLSRLQLDRDPQRGYPVAPGFSGTPIWDDASAAVIGIVLARDRDPDEDVQVGFGLSSEALDRHLAGAGILATWAGRSDLRPLLPAPPGPLVDREDEMAAIFRRLTHDGVRLLTLTGLGGVGKSRLALEAGWRIQSEVDRLHFVDLTLVHDPLLVVYELAARIGVSPSVGTTLIDALRTALQDTRALLVLDNFEHVIGAAPLLVKLLEGTLHLQFLVTSRARLRVPHEHALTVRPLQLPSRTAPLPTPELAHVPAVTMLVRRTAAIDDAFELTDDNAVPIAEICRRLDGLPLAIELAAPRLRVLGPEMLLDRLGRRLDLLTEDAPGAPPRHRSLRATLEWSYGTLPVAHGMVFAQLSAFTGGCTLEAARVVSQLPTDVLVDALAGLMDNSLLERSDTSASGARYQMLETVREYAESVVAASGSEPAVRDRHAAWCLRMAEGLAPARHREQSASLSTLDAELANVRAALGWLRRTRQLELALRLASAVAWYWDVRGQFAEGQRWLDGLLDDIGEADRPVSEEVRAHACYEAGFLAFQQGAYGQAAVRYDESLRHARRAGSDRLMAWALHGMSVLSRERGEATTSLALYAESRRLFERTGDRRGLARSVQHSAVVAFHHGEFEVARASGEACRELFRDIGDVAGEASAMNMLGAVTHHIGDHRRAVALLEEALALRRELGDQRGVAASLNNLGRVHLHRGDHELALRDLTNCLTIRQRLGDRRGFALALNNVAIARQELGDLDSAVTAFERCLDVWRDVGDRRGVATSLRDLGSACLAAGRHDQARALIDEARRICEELDDQFDVAQALLLAAEIAERTERPPRAAGQLLLALDLFERLGARPEVGTCLLRLADLAVSVRPALGARLVSTADRLAARTGIQLHARDVERRIRVLDVARRSMETGPLAACLAEEVDVVTIVAEAAAIFATEEGSAMR